MPTKRCNLQLFYKIKITCILIIDNMVIIRIKLINCCWRRSYEKDSIINAFISIITNKLYYRGNRIKKRLWEARNKIISGVSKLSGKVRTGDIEVKLSGCGDVTLQGSGKGVSCDISGASSVDLEDFKVDKADIELSGSSDAVINTDGKIQVEASGASTLKYKGDGSIESLDVSGAADVKKIK